MQNSYQEGPVMQSLKISFIALFKMEWTVKKQSCIYIYIQEQYQNEMDQTMSNKIKAI